MKNSLCSLFFVFSLFAQAQCFVDLGADRYLCSYNYNSNLHLGDSITASGFTGKLSYTWEFKHTFNYSTISYTLFASDLLDDTSSANPTLVYTLQIDTLKFKLTITDSLGNSCSDSLNILVSNHFFNLGNIGITIDQGDSVYINSGANVDGGIAPVTYLWRPNHGLRDSTSYTGFWVKPEYSIAYYITLFDAAGCEVVGAPYYYITVNNVGLEEKEVPEIKAYPNPTSGFFTIESISNNDIRSIKVYSLNGEMIKARIKGNTIDISGFEDGLYLIRIQENNSTHWLKVTKV